MGPSLSYWWHQRERISLECGSSKFNPWVRKIPCTRAGQPTPVFLPGESHGTEELGGLQSTGSQRVGHDRATNIFTQLQILLARRKRDKNNTALHRPQDPKPRLPSRKLCNQLQGGSRPRKKKKKGEKAPPIFFSQHRGQKLPPPRQQSANKDLLQGRVGGMVRMQPPRLG